MLNKLVYTKVQKGVAMIEYAMIVASGKFFSIKSQKGATMIEYALIAALVAIAAIVGLSALGVNLNTMFTNIGKKLPTP